MTPKKSITQKASIALATVMIGSALLSGSALAAGTESTCSSSSQKQTTTAYSQTAVAAANTTPAARASASATQPAATAPATGNSTSATQPAATAPATGNSTSATQPAASKPTTGTEKANCGTDKKTTDYSTVTSTKDMTLSELEKTINSLVNSAQKTSLIKLLDTYKSDITATATAKKALITALSNTSIQTTGVINLTSLKAQVSKLDDTRMVRSLNTLISTYENALSAEAAAKTALVSQLDKALSSAK